MALADKEPPGKRRSKILIAEWFKVSVTYKNFRYKNLTGIKKYLSSYIFISLNPASDKKYNEFQNVVPAIY